MPSVHIQNNGNTGICLKIYKYMYMVVDCMQFSLSRSKCDFRFMIPGDAMSRPNIAPIGATTSMWIEST